MIFTIFKKSTKFKVVIGLLFVISFFFYFSKLREPVEILNNEIIEETPAPKIEVLGFSVNNKPIEAYTFGNGENHLLFVGGIHGAYEWNSVLLAYNFIDYFTKYPESVASGLKLTIIPSANPDGLFEVVGKTGRFSASDISDEDQIIGLGRFNANNIDLNRNFDCKWKPESTWKGQKVSAGSEAFSEPEAKIIRNFVRENKLKAVVFWHSQAGAVYASECENGILPETLSIMNMYSEASGYRAIDSFDSYEVTGDAEGWLASIGIPAITVELETHEAIDWQKNLAGVKALLNYYGKEKSF